MNWIRILWRKVIGGKEPVIVREQSWDEICEAMKPYAELYIDENGNEFRHGIPIEELPALPGRLKGKQYDEP